MRSSPRSPSYTFYGNLATSPQPSPNTSSGWQFRSFRPSPCSRLRISRSEKSAVDRPLDHAGRSDPQHPFKLSLIFGNLGAPQLELAGAGIATLLARLLTWWSLWIYRLVPRLAPARPERWLRPLNLEKCRQAAKIGLPVTGQLTMEFGSFAAAALLIGQFGSAALAAHRDHNLCAAFTFMIPLGTLYSRDDTSRPRHRGRRVSALSTHPHRLT